MKEKTKDVYLFANVNIFPLFLEQIKCWLVLIIRFIPMYLSHGYDKFFQIKMLLITVDGRKFAYLKLALSHN